MDENLMNYRNAKFCRDGIRIDCEIEHPVHGWILFTCDPADTGAQFDVQELHQQILNGGHVASMTQAEIDAQDASLIRSQRDGLLSGEVDPLVSNPLRWADLSEEQQQAWADYRQALLNVPQQPSFPHEVEWPISPAALEVEEDTVLLRARNEDGTYKADDPATPNENEAWVPAE